MGDGFLATFKTRAVIIKTQDIKENDKIVWMFTEELGKISTIARGVKRGKSQLFSSTLQFCYGDYVLYKGKKMYVINESSLIDSFQGLLESLDTLAYASYFCELVDIAMSDEEVNKSVFVYLATALYLIKNNAGDVETIARAFELKILQCTGYGMNFDHCVVCGRKISTSGYLNLNYMGGICEQCEKADGVSIKYSTFNALKYISKIPLKRVCRVNLSDEVKRELYRITSFVISQNYFRIPKSLNTLVSLMEFKKQNC